MLNSLHVRILLGCFALTPGAAGVAQDDGSSPPEAIVLESESMTVDRTNNLFVAHRPRITQGNLSIEAEEATATSIDFSERSEWRFTGNVRITVGTAVLEAASAVFTFDDARLSRSDLIGTPVRFTDFDKVRQVTIEGRARQISYDYVARTMRMTEDAWVRRGQVEFFGCDVIYDFAAAERDAGFVVSGGSADCADKFTMLFRPDPEDQPDATDTPR
jgi:lipopolysaccharide transport protein LptA